MLNNSLQASGLQNASPSRNVLRAPTCCLVSGPCTTGESFRQIHVEILLRSDLTRVPLGVWLPQMIYTHCSFQSALHRRRSHPEAAGLCVGCLCVFVCLCAVYVCTLVCETLWCIPVLSQRIGFSVKGVRLGDVDSDTVSPTLLSKLWSGVGLPNAIGRGGLWNVPWLAECGGCCDSAGCDEEASCWSTSRSVGHTGLGFHISQMESWVWVRKLL